VSGSADSNCWLENLQGKNKIERHTFIPEDNIEMDHKERVCKVMDWIHLGQDRVGFFLSHQWTSQFQKGGKFNDWLSNSQHYMYAKRAGI